MKVLASEMEAQRWKERKSERRKGRETREGIRRVASDGFHVSRSGAELSWLQAGVVGH